MFEELLPMAEGFLMYETRQCWREHAVCWDQHLRVNNAVTQAVDCVIVGSSVNNGVEAMWKEAVMASFRASRRCSVGGSEQHHGKTDTLADLRVVRNTKQEP
jgi:hypothetical protein